MNHTVSGQSNANRIVPIINSLALALPPNTVKNQYITPIIDTPIT